jgi:hypothetical protein
VRRLSTAAGRHASPLPVIAGLVILATVLVGSAAWFAGRVGGPVSVASPAAGQTAPRVSPAAEVIDAKSKGRANAPILIEEWGDFQ